VCDHPAPEDLPTGTAASTLRELLNTGDSTPEVTRVLAGLWRISVPFPYGSLPSTQVYVLETSRGPVLIDTGCDDERAWHALTAGMQACGFDAADTCGVLITHGHSDHHGLSGRVREVSGAWIAMSRRERSFIDDLDYMSSGWAQHMLRTLILCGVPEPDRVTIAAVARTRLVSPDRVLEDGQSIDLAGWRVSVIATPGHTPGHVCYAINSTDVVFSGDHVLPSTTPRIGVAEYNGSGDSLADMCRSYERLQDLDPGLVLPGHEVAFHDLPGRCEALLARKRRQLDRVRDRLGSRGPSTAWTLTTGLEWGQPWSEIGSARRRLLVLEVLAAVNHLCATGIAHRDITDGVATFSPIDQ
jgi:glyoxylase-like metal-dependent hydrolase (beta-lactamase superfamily II)